MRILITGANGQLGRALQNECDKRGVNYVPTDFLPEESQKQNSFLTHLDITSFRDVERFLLDHPCDAIINCAAYNEVDKAESDWETAFLINAFGPKNLAIIANELQIPLVHFSTDYVFDGKKGDPYNVWDKPNPLSKYGESKLYGEELVARFTKKYYLIRLSWVFGDGRTNFVKKVLEWSKIREELRIVDDQISSPSYTVDLANAILDLTATGEYGTYHLSNSGYCSRYEWADYILKQTGWKGELIPVQSGEFKTAAKRPSFSVLGSLQSYETIGYKLPEWQEATKLFIEKNAKGVCATE